MFKLVLALGALLFCLQTKAAEPQAKDYKAVIDHFCKTGVPAITLGVVVDGEKFVSTTCAPKTGKFVLTIICDIDSCSVEEDKALPIELFERVLRSSEQRPGLGT
jgi:hypothetical protein